MNWPIQPLESFLTRITYGFTNPMPTTSDGPFMVTAKDVNHGRILYDQARRTSKEAFDALLTDKSRPEVGDVLVTKDGTLGRIAVVDRADVCINQSVAVLKPNSQIRSRFLRYLLEAPQNFDRMLGDADGTTIKHIYITRLGKMEVAVPDLWVQDQIAGVLGALDDKIELNRKTAAVLEEMARALYRSWFVDFDPVWAKAEGRPPAHMDASTAALFPDGFDDAGLPLGWGMASIYNFARVQYGAPFASNLFNSRGEGRPLVRIRDLKNNVAGFSTTEVHKGEYLIQPGDTVVGMDGDFTPYSWCNEPVLMNQRICCFLPMEARDKAFVRYGIPALLKFEEETAVATTVIHLGKKDIDRFTIVSPSLEILVKFGLLVNPWIDQIVSIGLQNQTLATLRDSLLPRLMSGELRVGAAHAMLEEVA